MKIKFFSTFILFFVFLGCAGKLIITSTPSDADVYKVRDDIKVGITPYDRDFTMFGTNYYSYKVKKDGFCDSKIIYTHNSLILAFGGTEKYHFDLIKEKQIAQRITSNPSGAKFFLEILVTNYLIQII